MKLMNDLQNTTKSKDPNTNAFNMQVRSIETQLNVTKKARENWYKNNADKEGVNLTLSAWNNSQNLPQIFEANDKWNALRADRIGDEFGVQYVIKTNGNEYQRIQEIAATKATLIVPVNYPMAMDVEDPNDARFVSLTDMKHWELAPTNAGSLEKAGINFCLTTADLRSAATFMSNLRKAIENGLSETKALEALTTAPAKTLGVSEMIGSLEIGKLANFIITTGNVFNEKTAILENWIQGNKYSVKAEHRLDEITLDIKSYLDQPED
jgi:hypothetical protein